MSTPQKNASERRALFIRIGITVALTGFVMWRLDLRAFMDRLTSFDPGWTALAFLTVFAAIVVSAWKWGLILRRRGYPLPYGRLLNHYFVGLFFNNVLPTTVGGDAVRAWGTTKDTGETPEAVGSVVTERLIAAVALGITALIGLPFIDASPQLLALTAIGLVLDAALVALFLVTGLAEGVLSLLIPARLPGLRAAATRAVLGIRKTLRNPALFARIMLLLILAQLYVAGASPRLLAMVALFLILDLVLLALFMVPKVADGIVEKLLPPRFVGLRETVSQTVLVVRQTLEDPALFAQVIVLSILFQISVATVNACIFKAMGVPVTLAQCIIFTPMIFTVTMLPISISGLGVREAAYWYFFSLVGVSQVDAVVASLAFFVIVGLASLPGAPLFILNRRKTANILDDLHTSEQQI